jgi:hypothetical protein
MTRVRRRTGVFKACIARAVISNMACIPPLSSKFFYLLFK